MSPILFSTFDVTRQVFFQSRLCFGLVNLKPIVPGHILVVPKRVVPRLADLTREEITDLFGSAQRIGQVVEREYKAESLTVACQDGPAAGQSVPHVHIHVLPRKWVDFGGNNDAVYPALDETESSMLDDIATTAPEPHKHRGRPQLKVDNESRKPRTLEEMEEEAVWLKGFFKDDEPQA
ncbi:hypothetical protein FRC04_007499 [Tulasnella sp. 424]|nr:hypothetical protein FRC04_007499 [Tulasnella sp. 424]KAG8975181.1 hypothetical protein FRC05_006349 [Tulasnella sp. 425]